MPRNLHPPEPGHYSPWGPVDAAIPFAEGIVSVHTPSHGGIWLSNDRLAQMPPDERSTDGWYEEDCEAAFPLRRFRDEVLHVCPSHKLDPFIEATMAWCKGSFAKIAMNRSP